MAAGRIESARQTRHRDMDHPHKLKPVHIGKRSSGTRALALRRALVSAQSARIALAARIDPAGCNVQPGCINPSESINSPGRTSPLESINQLKRINQLESTNLLESINYREAK
jgi:hypothetical protein